VGDDVWDRVRMWRRRRVVLWALFVLVAATNTLLELSSSVGDWWERSTEPSAALPGMVRGALDARPETNDGDVHLVMWFVAAALLVVAVGSWRRRLGALAALWLYTCSLELLQTLTRSRSAQWSDAWANGLGIAAAALGMALADAVWSRRRRQETVSIASGTGQDQSKMRAESLRSAPSREEHGSMPAHAVRSR
jgi:hypothetical protein